MLYVEAVSGLGPIAEDDGAIYNGGDSKCQVVVLEPLRPQYKQKGTGDGGDEDPERHGGVVQQAWDLSVQVTSGEQPPTA